MGWTGCIPYGPTAKDGWGGRGGWDEPVGKENEDKRGPIKFRWKKI